MLHNTKNVPLDDQLGEDPQDDGPTTALAPVLPAPALPVPAAKPAGAPMGLGNTLTCDYTVDHVRFHETHAVIVMLKDTSLQIGDPGFVGSREVLRFGVGDHKDAAPFQPGGKVRITVEAV